MCGGLASSGVLLGFLMLAAVRAFAGGVTLAWDPVINPSLVGYMVHYGPAAGNYPSSIDVGNTSTYLVSNLTDGSSYHFAVTTYDAAQAQSGFSNDVSATVPSSVPVAQFSASATSGPAPLTVNFSNTSTGSISTYAWTFGDTTTGSTQNPSHVYSSAGVYTVGLTVAGPGGSNAIAKTNYITVSATSQPTTTVVSSSANPSVVGASVTFTATVTGMAPTGGVGFSADGATLGGCGALALPTGSANTKSVTCSSSLTSGTHNIVATYAGDAANVGSTSTVLAQVVNGVVAGAPTLQAAASRKVHGAAGVFNLPLSLVPTNPSTEPRVGPAATVVLTFDKPLAGATVTVTEGTATAGAAVISGNDVLVNLTGVADRQYVTVSLTNVASTDGGSGGSGSVRVGFLAGDVNQSRTVTMSDVAKVKQQLSKTVTQSNFLLDVNASGTLTTADKGIVSADQTHSLPAP
jgi:PKD repeat protein